MKKTALIIVTILIVTTLGTCLIGCQTLDSEVGIAELKSAYANTRDNFNDIYQYSEKTYNKAVMGQDGSIVNRVVNVNCALDKHYNLLKDVDYAISIHEDKYSEKIDATSKLTTKFIASNDIVVGEARVGGDKSNIANAIFVTSHTEENGTKLDTKCVDVGHKAKDFYKSEYFLSKQLMNMQIMEEVGLLDADNMNFDIKNGGIVTKGRTTDFTFKATKEYLKNYESTHGKKSLLDGDKVWVQISHGRISNIYVYKTEQLGGGIAADYEAYSFMITYLGKKIVLPNVPPENQDKAEYERRDIFDGNVFEKDILSPSIR